VQTFVLRVRLSLDCAEFRSIADGRFILTDEKGGIATITIANVYQSNGLIQAVDSVLIPS